MGLEVGGGGQTFGALEKSAQAFKRAYKVYIKQQIAQKGTSVKRAHFSTDWAVPGPSQELIFLGPGGPLPPPVSPVL